MRRRHVRPVPARRLLAAALGAFTIIALAVAPALAHASPRTSSVHGVEAVGAAHVIRQSAGKTHPRHASVTAGRVQVASPKVTKVAKVAKATTVETDAPEANDTDQGDQDNVDEGQQGEQDQPDADDGPDDQSGDQSGGNDQSGDTGGD